MISEAYAKMAAFVIAVMAVLSFATLYVTSNPGSGGTQVRAEFEDSFPLLEGMNVRINGAIAGSVRKIEVNERGNADVVLALNEGVPAPRADASASIRQQDITGDSYVAYQPGKDSSELGAEGIGTERTLVSPRFDDLLDSFGFQERESLRIILLELGRALDGRGTDLNQAALYLRPALTEANLALSEVNQQNSVLRKFIRDAENVTGQLASGSGKLGKAVDSLAFTTQTTAEHSPQLDRALEALPATASRARTTLAALSDAAVAAEPVALEVAAAAPDLRTTIERIGPFLDEVDLTLQDAQPTLALSRRALQAAEPSLRAAPEKLITGPFELAGGVGDLFKAILGDKEALKGLVGADSYGLGPDRYDDIGLGSVAVEYGNQPGYPADYDPDRRFLRSALVPSCESFGVEIEPGCLTAALSRLRADTSADRSGQSSKRRRAIRSPEFSGGGKGGNAGRNRDAAPPAGTGLDPAAESLLEFLLR